MLGFSMTRARHLMHCMALHAGGLRISSEPPKPLSRGDVPRAAAVGAADPECVLAGGNARKFAGGSGAREHGPRNVRVTAFDVDPRTANTIYVLGTGVG